MEEKEHQHVAKKSRLSRDQIAKMNAQYESQMQSLLHTLDKQFSPFCATTNAADGTHSRKKSRSKLSINEQSHRDQSTYRKHRSKSKTNPKPNPTITNTSAKPHDQYAHIRRSHSKPTHNKELRHTHNHNTQKRTATVLASPQQHTTKHHDHKKSIKSERALKVVKATNLSESPSIPRIQSPSVFFSSTESSPDTSMLSLPPPPPKHSNSNHRPKPTPKPDIHQRPSQTVPQNTNPNPIPEKPPMPPVSEQKVEERDPSQMQLVPQSIPPMAPQNFNPYLDRSNMVPMQTPMQHTPFPMQPQATPMQHTPFPMRQSLPQSIQQSMIGAANQHLSSMTGVGGMNPNVMYASFEPQFAMSQSLPTDPRRHSSDDIQFNQHLHPMYATPQTNVISTPNLPHSNIGANLIPPYLSQMGTVNHSEMKENANSPPLVTNNRHDQSSPPIPKNLTFDDQSMMNANETSAIAGDIDEHLLNTVSPSVSDSTLRAIISQLRTKLQTELLKSTQQRKFISEQNGEKMKLKQLLNEYTFEIYKREEHITLLKSDSTPQLEQLRGAILNQSRMEVFELSQQLTEEKSKAERLKRDLKLQQINEEHNLTALRKEQDRLIREIKQHKMLYQQKCRELLNSNEGSDAVRDKMESQTSELKESRDKLSKTVNDLTDNLTSLRTQHNTLQSESTEKKAEISTLTQQLNQSKQATEQTQQELSSLRRANEAQSEEIESLMRTDRHRNEVRNTTTEQLLSMHQKENEEMRSQISKKYEKQLECEREKAERLQTLLHQMQMEQNSTNDACDDNHRNLEFLKSLETENFELRQRLEELEFGEKSSPYHQQSTAMMSEIGIQVDLNPPPKVDMKENMSDNYSFDKLMLDAAREEIQELKQSNSQLMSALNRLRTGNSTNQSITSTAMQQRPSLQSEAAQKQPPHTKLTSFIISQHSTPNKNGFERDATFTSPEKHDQMLMDTTTAECSLSSSFVQQLGFFP